LHQNKTKADVVPVTQETADPVDSATE